MLEGKPLKTHELMYDEKNDLIPCSCCGCEVPVADYSNVGSGHLCDFCASTLAGNHVRYAGVSDFTALRAEIWKAAAAVANYLKFPKEPT